MGYNFTDSSRDQMYLMPPSLREWLPPDHLAWFLLDACNGFDLKPFLAEYREDGRGQKAHHPQIMIPVLLYGYCQGERSSRQLERLCKEHVAYRILAANTQPDHCAFWRFRQRHAEALKGLFVEILSLCATAGLVKVGTIALDGTKMKANASRQANRTEKALEDEMAKIFQEAAARDAEEDALYGANRRGDELPEELRNPQSRFQRLKECRDRLNQEKEQAREAQEEKLQKRAAQEEATGLKVRGRKPKAPEQIVSEKEKRQANATDPESRLLKSNTGQDFIQGYNAQAAVNEAQVIVAQHLTQDENDLHQLHPMLALVDECLEEVGIEERPNVCLADAGYCTKANLEARSNTPELLVATKKDWKQRKEFRDSGPPRGRIPAELSAEDRMSRKLRTKRGRALYRKRSQIVEPVFGQIKGAQGIDRFLLRGLANCQCEWSLICTAHNLLKLWRSGKRRWN
jgi:transposase